MRHTDKNAGIKVNSRLAVRTGGKPGTAQRSPASFDQCYDELEQQRVTLLNRLSSLNDKARAHPGYKRALKLLNEIFRKSSLAQRLAVLNAANWSIDLLEQISTRT